MPKRIKRPKFPKTTISPDTLALNPAYASELAGGEWEAEGESVKKSRAKKAPKKSEDEKGLFLDALRRYASHLPTPIGAGGREFEIQPIPGKKNSCDWGWPEWKVIVEVDGGNWGTRWSSKAHRYVPTGRHTKDADYWKINEITALGWTVFRFTTTQLKHPDTASECVSQVLYYLKSKGFI